MLNSLPRAGQEDGGANREHHIEGEVEGADHPGRSLGEVHDRGRFSPVRGRGALEGLVLLRCGNGSAPATPPIAAKSIFVIL